MTSELLPRFPQPFLDLLAALVPVRVVLALTSVDRREAPMRALWLASRFVVVVNRFRGDEAGLNVFVARLPRCVVKQTVRHDGEPIPACVSPLHVRCDVSLRRAVALALPPSLTHLTFDDNRSLHTLALPPSLTHLTLGDQFYLPLDDVALPAALTSLTFGCYFNQPLDGVTLPASLTHLTFGRAFNQSLDRVALPASLTHLVVGDCFNKPLANVRLPPSLRLLSLSVYYNAPLGAVTLPQGALLSLRGR